MLTDIMQQAAVSLDLSDYLNQIIWDLMGTRQAMYQEALGQRL